MIIAAGVLLGSLAMAQVGNVSNTKHNFAIGGGSGVYQSTTISQVCIFCHTPHNAGQSRMLWNKATNGNTIFKMYSSSSLTNATRAAMKVGLAADSPSLLCLGCHDGKTAMNVLHSVQGGVAAPGYGAGAQYIATGATGFAALTMPGPLYDFFGNISPSMNLGRAADGSNDTLGTNLTDDHPIGFSYTAAQTETPARLNSIALIKGNVNTSNIKFFGATNKVECTSCHDPHIDNMAYPLQTPFLVMSNGGSKLCLACHNK